MCGQYWLYQLPRDIRGYVEPNWNWRLPDFPDLSMPMVIRPTNKAPVVRRVGNSTVGEQLKWGIKRRFGDEEKLLINARSESVLGKPTWKRAAQSKRCLVLASGWYEWTSIPRQKKKQKYKLFRKDQAPVYFGGLWFASNSDKDLDEYVILTVASHEEIPQVAAALHGRAPLIINRDNYEQWLDLEENNPEELLQPDMVDVIAEESE